jgi:hypothetical protein
VRLSVAESGGVENGIGMARGDCSVEGRLPARDRVAGKNAVAQQFSFRPVFAGRSEHRNCTI